MRITYDKIDRFIKTHNKIRYLVLFDNWCNKIYDRIKYLTGKNFDITGSINHNFPRIRIESNISLLIEKISTFHNVKILIKSVAMIIKAIKV